MSTNEQSLDVKPTEVPTEQPLKPLTFNDMVEQPTPGTPSEELTQPPEHEELEISSRFRTWTATPKFDQEDLSYPKLRLAQPGTAEVVSKIAEIGDWVLTGYKPEKKITFIPLRYTKVREYRDKDDNRKVLCQSRDAVMGVGTPGGLCDVCPLSEWGGDKDNRKPPACNVIYSYLGWSMQHESIVVMEFKKTGKGVANFLNINIQNKGFGNFAVDLTSQAQVNAQKQNYSTPVVTFAQLEEGIVDRAVKALPA